MSVLALALLPWAAAEGLSGFTLSAYTTVRATTSSMFEVVVIQGVGQATVYLPGGAVDGPRALPFAVNDTTPGDFEIVFQDDQPSGWDVSVLAAGGGAVTGRVWSDQWRFDDLDLAQGQTAKLYAPVPLGDAGGHAVYMIYLQGVAGNNLSWLANDTGIELYPASSQPYGLGDIEPQYPIYLAPPDVTRADLSAGISTPSLVSDYEDCPALVYGHDSTAQIELDHDGTVHLICDTNSDGVFDVTDDDEHLGSGDIQAGAQTPVLPAAFLDDVPSGAWDCVFLAAVGEVHFLVEDAETAYPGVALWKVEPNGAYSSRTIYWNDAAIQDEAITMPDGEISDETSGPDGVFADASAASIPNETSHGWGAFGPTSKGDEAWVDTWTWYDAVASDPLTVPFVSEHDDTDGDGLSDAVEVCTQGTDFESADTDNDGASDGAEVDVGSDPLNEDTDGDNLLDGEELNEHGSDPLSADTDGDGIDDGVEVAWGLDLLSADTDGDGLTDGEEWTDGDAPPDTDEDGDPDPADDDDDGDGIPTAVESSYADPDVDGDGAPNHLDTDSDGDGYDDDDPAEGTDDDDGDGVPNYLDPDTPGTASIPGAYGGSSLCAGVSPAGGWWILTAIALLRRRR